MSLMFQPLWRYADFHGRASRTEFWLFQVFVMVLIAGFTAALLTVMVTTPRGSAAFFVTALAAGAAYLALFIPRQALIVRRLHDSDNSGFWMLIGLAPGGGLAMLVFSLIPGTVGSNRHGEDPRGPGLLTTGPAAMALDSAA